MADLSAAKNAPQVPRLNDAGDGLMLNEEQGGPYHFPRTEPLIFFRVVLPVCKTGIALSTSE